MSSKTDKEAFVSNLHGGDVREIFLFGSVFVLSFWIWKVRTLHCRSTYFAVEYALLLVPIVLSCTLLANQVYYVLLGQLATIVLLHTRPLPVVRKDLPDGQESFINAFRCYLQMMTCIAILAVDFRVFPRRLAKTETYGTSLMDA
ncbi:hypothetical protein HDU91_005657, partial [Kappamyces sp. JEL0680]